MKIIIISQGGQNIYSNTKRFTIAEANSSSGLMNSLTIRDVSREDGGKFICIASNQFGSQALPTFLAVFEPPEPPTSVYVMDVTSRAVVLAWYPAFDGNSPVLNYMVQHKVRNLVFLHNKK